MKCNWLQVSAHTRWRALAEDDSLLCSSPTSYCHHLHPLSFPFLPTPPLLTDATTAAASTSQIAIFVIEPIDVEKAIIWASRSGNGVLVEVAH